MNVRLGHRTILGVEEEGFYPSSKQRGQLYRWTNGHAALRVPLGEGERGFMKMWVKMMREAVEFPFDQMLPTGMTHELQPAEMAAYKAPFPDTQSRTPGQLPTPTTSLVHPSPRPGRSSTKPLQSSSALLQVSGAGLWASQPTHPWAGSQVS